MCWLNYYYTDLNYGIYCFYKYISTNISIWPEAVHSGFNDLNRDSKMEEGQKYAEAGIWQGLTYIK